MKKIFAVLLTAALLVTAFAGCGSKNGGSVTWLADGAAHPLTVTVKNGNETVVYTVNVTKAS